MKWFENQIEDRRLADQQLLEDSFVKIAGVVLGRRESEKYNDERIITKNAIDEILKFYHFKPVDLPDNVKTADEQLDYCLRPNGLMRRTVKLTEKWYKNAFGPMLMYTKEEGIPVAVLPSTFGGYTFLDPKTNTREKMTSRTSAMFDEEAVCFYKPLPQKKLGIPDLLIYMQSCITIRDIVFAVVTSLIITGLGIVLTRITKALTGPILVSGTPKALIFVAITMVCTALTSQLISSAKGLVLARVNTKTSMAVQSAMIMRLLALPASFFRKYSPGELRQRALSVNELCSTIMDMIFTTGLTSVTSLLYVTQIFSYAPALVIPSLITILATVVFSVATTLMQIKVNRKEMNLAAKESGMSYSMITGVQKIKLAGAEKRIFAKWMDLYAEGADLLYNPPTFLKVNSVISTGITLISTIVIYFMAVSSGVDPSSYYAFSIAYGLVSGSFMSVAGIALSVAQIKPVLEMAEPFLTNAPETSDDKEIVTKITGGVEIDHVSFRYTDDTPYILNDISLKIKAGEYVAIVGRTGCGKSTLVRLLLGFEKPERGAILYDGKNLDSMDLPSLRKKIGTVMQDAGLFQGEIYQNIVITAPELTLKDAWEAAEKAGIADDIRAMPMGMNTMVSEGQGGVSGGQKQRLMIARAIAPKPKLLIFDEATSALDNKTQKQVSDALDAMGCTRIVIAHRLSTIRHCDRILVMDGGKIIESGTYDELIALNGYFAELVERQRLDVGTED